MWQQRQNLLLWVVTFGCVAFAFSGPLRADSLQVSLPELKVYGQPNPNSEVITTLFKGDVVPVSKNSPAGYKKVLIQDGSQKKIGYVRIADLQPRRPLARVAPIRNQQRDRNKRAASRTMRNRYSFGLMGGMNYQNQGSRTYTDANGGNANIGALSGAAAQFGAFFNIPLNFKYMIDAYFMLKTVSVTGSATYTTTTVPSVPESTLLNETFLTIGALIRDYPSRSSNWWFGGGLQLDHGSSGNLQFGTFPVTSLGGSDLPNFIFMYGAIGADFRLGGDFFITPDIRIGGVVNALPIILEADGNLSISYAL